MSEHDVATQIRAHSPAGARAYYLWNHSGRYPTQGGFSLDPISTPFGLQPGEYRIAYLAEITSVHPLQPRSVSNPSPTIKISQADGQALSVAPPSAAPERAAKGSRDPIEDHPEHLRNRVEFEAIRMADQTVTNQQLVAKRLTRNRELGELLIYARAHRQELEQNMRLMSEMSRAILSRANEAAQLVASSRSADPSEQAGPFVGILGQLLQLLNSAVSSGKGRGEPVLDALLGGEDEGKLAAVLKELKALRRKVSRNKKADRSEGRKTERKPDAKKPKKAAARPKSQPKKSSREDTTRSKKSTTRKQLPAKGGR